MFTLLKRSVLVMFPILLAVGLSATLSGCSGGGGGSGGGSDNTPVSTPTPSATTTSVVSDGPITRFGSVVLNGIEFDTTQAEIRIEDRVVREDELRIGMRVIVEGVRDNNGVARATRVIFRKNVEGLIDRIDVVNNTLVVLGQTVLVDGLTVLEDRAQLGSIPLTDLVVGQFVEVSGMVDANGMIVATRIERKAGFIAGVTEVAARGTISRLDTNAGTFVLGALTVNFSTATVVGTLGNGVFAQVRGAQTTSGGIVTATRVTAEDQALGGVTGAKVEIEGFVTVVTPSTAFRVNGQAVTTTVRTVFENGTAVDIVQNARLEVEGQLDANGTLVAEKISFRRRTGGTVHIEADVEVVTANTVTLLGLVIRVDVLTQFKDDMGGERGFRFDRIHVRDRLEIRGFLDAQGNIIVTRLRRRGPANEIVLRGPVDSVAVTNLSLVVRGIEIRTDGSTVFKDFSPNRPTAAQFFAALRPGALVKAKGVLLRGTPVAIRATQVTLEDLDRDDDL